MPALPQIVNQQTVSYQNIRVGAGNPNTIKQYGEPGWIYQDWTGGALYVCTVAGTAGWTLSSSGGQPSNPLLDAGGVPSVDFYNRWLTDSSGNTTLDWSGYQLIGVSDYLSIDWDARALCDGTGTQALNWNTRNLTDGQWTTLATGKTYGNLMSNATYTSTTLSGAYNPAAPANAGMVIFHQASSGALIASMTLQLHGATSAIDSVPIGGDISFTSRYGVTTLTVTYGSVYTLLGTAATTCAAGATITWRKLSSTIIARIT